MTKVKAIDFTFGVGNTICDGVSFNIFVEESDIGRAEFPVSLNFKKTPTSDWYHVGNYRMGSWLDSVITIVKNSKKLENREKWVEHLKKIDPIKFVLDNPIIETNRYFD